MVPEVKADNIKEKGEGGQCQQQYCPSVVTNQVLDKQKVHHI